MGKVDHALRHYLSRDAVFAELFNVGVYGGRKVIAPERLSEVQRTYAEALPDRYGKKKRRVRERDLVKALYVEGHYVRLAVENQGSLNYCMPLRCLEYDVEDFARQLRRLQRRNRQEKTLKPGAEYLSGIRKTDKLIPNITVVLYHGTGKWNAADQLLDMIDMAALDERMGAMHMNYRLFVIPMSELDESFFETGLRELVGMMKYADDKEKMDGFIAENRERFESMDDELYDLICAVVRIREFAVKKIQYENENRKGRFNMCKAWEDMKAECEKRGEKRGERRGEKRGEERLGTLISLLYQEGREADVPKAAGNVRFRRGLYREFGI